MVYSLASPRLLLCSVCGHVVALLSWLAFVWVLWGQGQRFYLHVFCITATSRALFPVAADLEMHAVHDKGERAGERGRFLEPEGPRRTFSSTFLFHLFRRRLKPEELLSFSLAQCFRVSSTPQQHREIEIHPYSEDVDKSTSCLNANGLWTTLS